MTEPSNLETAWARQYERVGKVFLALLGMKRGKVAEIGCGKGQLTFPLAKRTTSIRFTLVDRFVGTNYSRNYRELLRGLRKARLTKRAKIVVSDYVKWLGAQENCTYDAVISSEFIPELDSDQTHQFIQQCFRILKPKGVTIHSFLSPIPRNSQQRLLMTADSNPLWTRTPPKEWFSPKPERIVRELEKTGFHRIREKILAARLIMKGNAAKSWLKSAEVKSGFYERHKGLLTTSGLEVPDWVIVSGIK
ncbi:MAG TPA: class I SAM-dependent methyltransferase [archaeon]|nr:class I SAM-dependent methyltransferase [archaeon]